MALPVVFISYSHKDEAEKEVLLSHLGVLQKNGLIDLWSDERIAPGRDWKTEITQAATQSKVAVLLISADFLSSDFIISEVVPILLQSQDQQGLVVVPVIAKACPWKSVTWLNRMKVRPRNGKPIWRDGGRYANEEITTIAEEIGTIIHRSGMAFNESVLPTLTQPASSVSVQSESIQVADTNQPIRIYVPGDYYGRVSDEVHSAAIAAYAAVMGVSLQEVEVYRIGPGSIVYDLGVPSRAVKHLRSLLQSNDEQLHKLSIEKVRMEGETGQIEEWTLKDGRFELIILTRTTVFGVNGKSQSTNGTGLRDLPLLDFSTNSEIVRIVVEGERLRYGHLFNPAFATEISLIEPLPHQRIAVYERMLPQTRLRFLLADDAGAGKTIMTGLYIREMLTRRLIRRVLIVPPAGLVGNWENELRSLFSLSFRVVHGNEAKSENPFSGPDSDRLIVSIDTLAGERMFSRLQEPEILPYDLIVFDEAHKLSASQEPDFRIRRTNRYHLAEALVGIADDREDNRWQLDWVCQHLLLLTATPHMGKDFPYYALWRLLQPEVLSTLEAFNNFPPAARQHHFIRRTKEEMVWLDGTPIYPERISDTLSYKLTQGDISEQTLYDQTTAYISGFYNQATILNRSAVRFAMTIFQRRLTSSTYALICSLRRRIEKLEGLIDGIKSGRITLNEWQTAQQRLDDIDDVFEEETGDEETPDIERGLEENEIIEDKVLAGVVGTSLAELEVELWQVRELLDLAQQVYDDPHEESKFAKLHEILDEPDYRDEKIIIFTEHKDTLNFLVQRLAGIGFPDQIAQIHGGMDYKKRQEQVEFFRHSVDEGGAKYLVATDAAGEGINLQFCWIMVNYDIPWNPARLEQRMGRIHRFGQMHDPVVIMNLASADTREGKVLKKLLDKLELIRRQLGSDKVFDVIGHIFRDISIKAYMEQALTEAGARAAQEEIERSVDKERVVAIDEQEQRLYRINGDVQAELPRLRADLDQETYLKLLPSYVRSFVERAAPWLDIGFQGNLDRYFSLQALRPRAIDPLWSALERYPPELQNRLTFHRPEETSSAIFVHPGEPIFDQFANAVQDRFAQQALRGGIFVDPTAEEPYLFYLVLLSIERQADPDLRPFTRPDILEYRLVALRQQLKSNKDDDNPIETCAVEHLLLLRGGEYIPAAVRPFVATISTVRERAYTYLIERVAWPLAYEKREIILKDMGERAEFLRRGFEYQEIELAVARKNLRAKANEGSIQAKGRLTLIRKRQRNLEVQRDAALAALYREPELIAPGEVTFLAHALVVPSDDPEDRKRHNKAVEIVAVNVVRAYEEARGAVVKDVSTPKLALAAGLGEHPGFDLLSFRPDGHELAIEVKGRARVGDVELSENEWLKAAQLQDKYWLYVVYDCATSRPSEPLRVRNPVKMAYRARGGVIIDEGEIFAAAEREEL